MSRFLNGYKLCKLCGEPMLKKGQKRKHRDDYRHASGCPAEPRPKGRKRKERAK